MLREARTKLKFKALARALGSEHRAISALEMLWHATATNTPDGGIGRFTDDEIELEIGWEGEPGAAVEALVSTRWVDRIDGPVRLYVHDWHHHADHSTHRKLARSRTLFANGEAPKVSTLPENERKQAAEFYKQAPSSLRVDREYTASNSETTREHAQESLQGQGQGLELLLPSSEMYPQSEKRTNKPASPACAPVPPEALRSIEEAFGAYGKRPRAWNDARRRQLRARAAEFSVEALAHGVHGYAWKHRAPTNGFDPMANFDPETVFSAKFAKYLEAYEEALASGHSPPFRIEPRAGPNGRSGNLLADLEAHERAKGRA